MFGSFALGSSFTNGGFDTGTLSPWAQTFSGGNEEWNVTGAVSQSGGFSATNIGNTELKQSFSPMAAGSVTVLSFWLRTQTVGQQDAVDLFYDGGGFTEVGITTTAPGFNFFDFTSRVDPTRALDGFGVFGADGARTYLDTVDIEQAPAPLNEAPSLAILAAALLAVVLGNAYRRRASPA